LCAVSSDLGVLWVAAYRDKKVVGVFVRFSCAASSIHMPGAQYLLPAAARPVHGHALVDPGLA
jgi:hypothetical protein